MKKIFNLILLGAIVISASSCKKYLDINTNTNASTVGPVDLVLPQAITATAALSNTYSNSLGDIAGGTANIFGVGGYGAYLNYNFVSTSYNGLWTAGYDVANDFNYVIEQTQATPSLAYSTAMARIGKAFVIAKLVDQFNDIPYSEAFKGQSLLTPKYDNALTIYKDLVAQLNTAMTAIASAHAANIATPGSVVYPNVNADPLYKPTATESTRIAALDNWRRFANTLKLRLLIKIATSGKDAAFATAQFAAYDVALGVITDDAAVNPGYIKDPGRQNPTYQSWGYGVDNVRSNAQRVPTNWILSFYDGTKISDVKRGSVTFRNFPSPALNQLGNENAPSTAVPPTSPISSSSWFTGTSLGGDALGFVKGSTQAQPIFLLAEAKFLQAEAYVRGYLTGTAQTAYEDGVKASIRYLYKNAAGTVDPSVDTPAELTTEFNAYKAANPAINPVTNIANPNARLVDYSLAVGVPQQLEAIITQKYIALMYITSDEAFNEFRRTTFPTIVNGSLTPTATFASRLSNSTRADKLPARLPYPSSEFTTNAGNIPSVSVFGSLIFWDLN